VSERLSRRLDRLEAMAPPPSGSPEARAKMLETLETLKDLILEHGDEIDSDCRERVAAGQDHKEALIAAKRAVWGRTAEGRAALEVLDAVQDRGGG
jgi:hypothetical protein